MTTLKCQFGQKLRVYPVRFMSNFGRLRSNKKKDFMNSQLTLETPTYRKLWKPLTFTVLFSGAVLTGTTIMEYERIRARTYSAMKFIHKKVQKTGWRRDLQIWWNRLLDGERLFACICFANMLIFLAWRVPALKPYMMQHFCSNATGNGTWSMILSTFSHYSFIHLMANMIALYSFTPAIVAVLGKEQFLALYLISGAISSYISILFKVVTKSIVPSLGASGAVLGIVGYFCMQFPEGKISLIFLPMFSFTAITALKSVLLLDVCGCLLKWKVFDHAAHLGGSLTGIFWYLWGCENIWGNREPIVQLWDKFRR